ncbi:MAG: ATP-dependent DNA ligase, partial [Micromonosporaceae bacterium]|nr:ATP-dependent DNA ligase [Micromonosporaceae bacterium]
MAKGDKVRVKVGERELELSNLGKPLYPNFTKAEVIDYYSRIAPVLLPHLEHRPATRIRFPDGVDGQSFFEKNAPSHTPDWVRTVTLPSPGSSMGRDEVRYVVAGDLPTLVWLANLAALELHTPQWTVGPRGAAKDPDRLVFDLDPGAPAALPECLEVALLLRERLASDGLEAYPKTSGKKGLQLVCAVSGRQDDSVISGYAKQLAEELERAEPGRIVSKMAKQLRPGKVLIDWSQNNAAKTTVTPYSLRAQAEPTVSAPLTWDEVEAGGRPRFTSA